MRIVYIVPVKEPASFSSCLRLTHVDLQKNLAKMKKLFVFSFHLCDIRKIRIAKPQHSENPKFTYSTADHRRLPATILYDPLQ